MSDGRQQRVALVAILLAGTLSCLVWFGATPIVPEAGVFPENDEVILNYDANVGDRVLLSGPVASKDPLIIHAETETGDTMALRVTNADPQLSEGDVLSVYGVLQPGQQVEAINTVVKPAGNYWRTRILSAFAGLWVLWRGLHHWRPNVRAVIIERREDSDA
jgi:hypothetical protein